jgi:hypothetical protein
LLPRKSIVTYSEFVSVEFVTQHAARMQGKGKKVKFTLEQAAKAEAEQRYTYTLSLTSALPGGRWATPRPGPTLPPPPPG